MRALISCVMFAIACGGSSSPSREIKETTAVDGSGLSATVEFEIPERTRSITVIARGDAGALFALGELTLGDGIDLVQLPTAPIEAMQMSYQVEQVGQMPGMLYQSIRLGTFTHVYPYKMGQGVIAGDGRLRIASDRPGKIDVTILMPEDNGAGSGWELGPVTVRIQRWYRRLHAHVVDHSAAIIAEISKYEVNVVTEAGTCSSTLLANEVVFGGSISLIWKYGRFGFV